MSDISSEITDSLSRSGKGAMLAPLELANGTAGAPALSFDSDTDCGLWRKGANNIALGVNGAEVLDLQTTGVDVTGALVVSSTLAATGAATLSSTLAVTGAATLTGGLAGTTAIGGSNPASSTAISNSITRTNLAKAWALLTPDGAGNVTVTAGFNIASATISGAAIRVTLASAMASASYCPIAQGLGGSGFVVGNAQPISSTVLDISAMVLTTAPSIAAVDFATSTRSMHLVVFGAQ